MRQRKSQSANSDMNLEERALGYLKTNGTISVQALHDELSVEAPSLTKAEVTDMLWRLAEQDKVNLEDVPPITRSFAKFLRLWERHLRLYASLTLSFATVLAVYVMPAIYPLVVLRWVLGLLFVLFIPGYVTVEALFPRGRDLDRIERYALSIGLSLAEVPLVCLMLNPTPWGIQLTSIVVSLTILTVGLSIIALTRQYTSA
ncbi:MAG: DUF1616 domain-containing protein [Candidatus Bathyarchaeia archaeon]|jgi:hypothetical protein